VRIDQEAARAGRYAQSESRHFSTNAEIRVAVPVRLRA